MKYHRAVRQIWLVATLAALAFGCSSPEVAITRTEAGPVHEDGRLTALKVHSWFEARGLAGKQVIYQVRIVDHQGRPIPSRDGRYRTRGGAVGGRRALMVSLSPQVFEDISVSIPTSAMSVRPVQLPIQAHIGIYQDGDLVASGVCPLPVRVVQQRLNETLNPRRNQRMRRVSRIRG